MHCGKKGHLKFECNSLKRGDPQTDEGRKVFEAWEKAKKRTPDARLSILTSEETGDSNELILDALPPEVRFWYYHSLYTYNTSQTPIVPGYLAQSAKRARKVGVCLNLMGICQSPNGTDSATCAAFFPP